MVLRHRPERPIEFTGRGRPDSFRPIEGSKAVTPFGVFRANLESRIKGSFDE